MTVVSVRSAISVLVGGLLWAVTYSLVWGVAWFAFMQAAWYSALSDGNRQLPWAEIWSIWAVLNVPLGMATVAYLRQRVAPQSRAVVAVVLVLWVPMTMGMTGWAWYESLSLKLIALDSAVNLVGLAAASLLAHAVVRGRQSQHTVPTKS